MYACDRAWWVKYEGVPEFEGLKVSQDAQARDRWGVQYVPSIDKPGLSLDPSVIHQGGNSGYQAINLAVLLGAARILLFGYDMHGEHWHGRHPDGLNNAGQDQMARWAKGFETMVPDLKRAGVEVLNCTPESAVECFPMVKLEAMV